MCYVRPRYRRGPGDTATTVQSEAAGRLRTAAAAWYGLSVPPPVLSYANAVGPGPLRHWTDGDGWHACASLRATPMNLIGPWIVPAVALAVWTFAVTSGLTRRVPPPAFAAGTLDPALLFLLPVAGLAAWGGWLTWQTLAGRRVEVAEVIPRGGRVPSLVHLLTTFDQVGWVHTRMYHGFGTAVQWRLPARVREVEVRHGRLLRVTFRDDEGRHRGTDIAALFRGWPADELETVAEAMRRALAEFSPNAPKAAGVNPRPVTRHRPPSEAAG